MQKIDFSNQDVTLKWLMLQPAELSIFLASRRALRLLPQISLAKESLSDDFSTQVLLPVMRAVSIALIAQQPACRNLRSASVIGAAKKAAVSTERAASAIQKVPTPSGDEVGAALAASFAASAVFDDSKAYRAASESAFTRVFEAQQNPHDTYARSAVADVADYFGREHSRFADALSRPVWSHTSIFPAVERQWGEVKQHLDDRHHSENWQVWTDWYDARLRGDPIDWELQRAFLQPPEVWEAGPKVLNDTILRRMEEIEAERRSVVEGAIGSRPRWPPTAQDFDDARRRLASEGVTQARPDTATANAEELLARIKRLEDILAVRAAAPGQIGHNQPPEDARLTVEDLDVARDAAGEIRQELESGSPDLKNLARQGTRLAKFFGIATTGLAAMTLGAMAGFGGEIGSAMWEQAVGLAPQAYDALRDALVSLGDFLRLHLPKWSGGAAPPPPEPPPILSV